MVLQVLIIMSNFVARHHGTGVWSFKSAIHKWRSKHSKARRNQVVSLPDIRVQVGRNKLYPKRDDQNQPRCKATRIWTFDKVEIPTIYAQPMLGALAVLQRRTEYGIRL